jgi:hypothetical protein
MGQDEVAGQHQDDPQQKDAKKGRGCVSECLTGYLWTGASHLLLLYGLANCRSGVAENTVYFVRTVVLSLQDCSKKKCMKKNFMVSVKVKDE